MYYEVKFYLCFSEDLLLPHQLRVFTSGAVYVRILSMGIDQLQLLGNYTFACQSLELLLHQSVYCLPYRGRWYDRLALNLERYLKQIDKVRKI